MEEIWKDIKGYEGVYQVSNLGRIKSFPRRGTINSGKIIKSFLNKTGYYYVYLHKQGMRKILRLHRIVAEAFIPNPENKKTINHINRKQR